MNPKPISARELIRYLPDLLTGNEPAIDDPAIQRFIREDPEGRAALYVITETAAAMTVGAASLRSLARSTSPDPRTAIARARLYARHRLADLMFDVGSLLLRRGAELRGEVTRFDCFTPGRSSEGLDRHRLDALLRTSELSRSASIRVRAIAGNELIAVRDARACFAASARAYEVDAAIVRGREGTDVLIHHVNSLVAKPRSPREWAALVTTYKSPQAQTTALHSALRGYLERNDFASCTALADRLRLLVPDDPVAIPYVFIVDCWQHRTLRALACAHRLTEICTRSAAHQRVIEYILRSEFRTVARRSGESPPSTLIARLPAWIADIVTRSLA